MLVVGMRTVNLLFENAIDERVYAADEKACDTGHAGRVPAAGGKLLHSRDESFGNLLVSFLREQQRDVYVYALADQLLNRRDPRSSSRHLDHQILAANALPEATGLFERALCVICQLRRDFETYVAVATLRCRIHLLENVGRVLDVTNRNLFVDAFRIEIAGVQASELVGIVVAAGDSLLENRRIRGDTGESIFIDVPLQLSAGYQAAADIVEPD